MVINNLNYIKGLKCGKEDALEFIVDKYLPLVKGITHKILSPVTNNETIEECINDIFLSVWNNSKKFKGEECDFKKWLCAIAKFKAIDYYRRNAVRNLDIDLDEEDLPKGSSAEDEVIVMEQRDEVLKLINTLDSVDREIFIRKFFLDEKSDEIAKKLGVTKASIDNRIYRGKKKLNKRRVNFKWGII